MLWHMPASENQASSPRSEQHRLPSQQRLAVDVPAQQHACVDCQGPSTALSASPLIHLHMSIVATVHTAADAVCLLLHAACSAL